MRTGFAELTVKFLMRKIAITLIICFSASSFAAVNQCKGNITNQVLQIDIEDNVDNSDTLYSINIAADNEWKGHKLLGISMESIGVQELTINMDTVKGAPENGGGANDINKSYAFFLGSEKWLKGEYCIFAHYSDKGSPHVYSAAMTLKLNKALKAQPSAAGTPQSGAP